MSDQPQRECQARQVDAAMVCDRCALVWDLGDSAPACRALTFGRMRDAATTAAMQIEASAAAAVSGGFRKLRHQDPLKLAAELHGCARLVERCLNDPEILSRLASRPKAGGG